MHGEWTVQSVLLLLHKGSWFEPLQCRGKRGDQLWGAMPNWHVRPESRDLLQHRWHYDEPAHLEFELQRPAVAAYPQRRPAGPVWPSLYLFARLRLPGQWCRLRIRRRPI